MKRKILSVIVAAAMMMTAPSSAFAAAADETVNNSGAAVSVQESGETEGDYEYTVLDDGTVEISKYSGRDNDVTIPSELGGKKVTSIGDKAFYGILLLKSVIIPETVTNIGQYAFGYCSTLANITIPKTVTSIDVHAFVSTVWIRSYDYEDNNGFLIVGNDILFKYQGSDSNITIPDGVTCIGDAVFKDCKSVESITIPDSVTSIGESVFNNCTSLVSVTIPDSVTSIGESVFKNCSSLVSITIPDSVTSIGDYVFEGCTSLVNVVLPNTVTEIVKGAFKGCASLTGLTLPDSVTSIGGYAFYGCTSLTSVTVPDSVTSIKGSAFSGCTSLESITLPNSLTNMGGGVFNYCTSLESIAIPDSVTSIGISTFSGCSSLESIAIPDSVTSIGESAFARCTSLTNIVIPDSVMSLGYNVFSGCTALANITLPKTVKFINGSMVLTSIDSNFFSDCSALTSITIPDSVTSLGSSAFSGCTSLVSITMPDSVTSIGDKAFDNCKSLSSITIPNSVTRIESWTFQNCTSLTNITIPESVTSILSYAFYNCTSLTSITIPETVTGIGNNCFTNCKSLTIYGSSGSYAEQYAKDNDIPFVVGSGENNTKTDISICTATLSQLSYTYDGTAKIPTVTVKNGSTTLTPNTDYTVNYTNNINAGTATVTITGTGNYTGTKVINFTIAENSKIDISTCSALLNQSSFTYDGTEKKPTVSVINNGTVLADNTDYTVSYSNNINIGTAAVTITGTGEYTGTKVLNFTIAENSKIDISTCSALLNQSSFTYDGTEKKPTVSVINNGTVLAENTDYTVSYSNNINIGTAEVTITGTGEYTGTKVLNFTIEKAKTDISSCTAVLSQTSYTYDGSKKLPNVSVLNNGITLVKDTDYTLAYKNSKNVGTAEVTVSGTGDYTGSITLEYEIKARSIENASLTISPNSFMYDGTEKSPTVTLTLYSQRLQKDTDYTALFSDNVNVGTATVTVVGKGNYTGTKTAEFTINEKTKTDISSCTASLDQTSFVYDGTEKKPTVTVKNGDAVLTEKIDYTVAYSNNVNAALTAVQVVGIGDYFGSISLEYEIEPRTIKNAEVTLNKDSFEYNGSEKCPTATVKLDSKTLKDKFDYYILYKDNIKEGTATATVAGKGNYTGNKSVEFTITAPKYVKKPFVWGTDNWNFVNNDATGHFSSGTYRSQINKTYLDRLRDVLSPCDYQLVFQGSGKEKAWLDENFGGSCYGMSATTLLAKQGLLPFSDYQPGAATLNELDYPTKNPLDYPSKEANVSSLITYYQMLQVTDPVYMRRCEVGGRSKEENIKDIISLLDQNDTVLLGFRKDGWGGHAILAYDYDYGSYTKDGITYQGRIMICDPNSASTNNAAFYLYFNTTSYNWAIPAYSDADISSAKGARITNICADVDIINYGGYLSSGDYKPYVDNYVARIDAYAISDNRSVAKVKKSSKDADYSMMDKGSNDIVEEYSYVDANQSKGVIGYNLYDAESAYKVIQEDAVDMQLSIHYEDCYLTGGSKAGESVLFDKEGYIEVSGESAEYSMSMTMNEDHPTDWFTISVVGEDANKASLSLDDNGWVISADDLSNVRVDVNNKFDAAYTTFTTEYPSALIYEIDENTIGIAVDADSNGSYETTLKTETTKKNIDELSDTDQPKDHTPGDINSDGKVNMKDLTRLHQHINGWDVEVNEAAMDVNGDGKVNMKDLTRLHQYLNGWDVKIY